MKEKLKALASSSIGTMLEFYDFTLYGVFSVVIAKLFFPFCTEINSLILSLAVYATGSFMRPLGGILFGYIGDKYGRRPCLLISILCMAFSTVIIGMLPDYSYIGIFAPILLLMCRLIQGLSAGGEFNNACIFAMEHVETERYGFIGSLIVASGTVGTLCAMSIGALVTLPSMPTWGWRIPFLLGCCVSIAGFYIRHRTTESPGFVKGKQSGFLKSYFKKIFPQYKVAFFKTVGIAAFASSLAFTVFNYINIYLNKHIGLPTSYSMFLNTWGLILFVILTPCMGWLSDKIKASKIMTFSAVTTFLSIYPIYLLLSSGNLWSILFAQLWLVLLSSSFSGSMNALLITFFPMNIRCTGISFGFTVGVAIFGGTMPLISSFLISKTDNLLSPSFYMMFCSVIALLALKKRI